MKKVFVFAVLGMVAAAGAMAGTKAPWMTPEVNSINRLPARAIVVPCENEKTAIAIAKGEKNRIESKWLESLNGTWNFKWRGNILEKKWEKSGTIKVPGCWQLQGDYDPALYTNVRYPLVDDGTGNPMLEPPKNFTLYKYRNPVGLYSRNFTLPCDWQGRRVVIHFGGVSSAMYLRVNGKEAGYSEDSRLPAEFDITSFLKPGENSLEVEVIKHCDGTFIEDQDFWRLSGIFRDVWLVCEQYDAPKDIIVGATLSKDYKNGSLRVTDETGRVLLAKRYDKPRLWSCETPNMYYETFHCNGDYYAVSFGFRHVEIKDAVLYINGKRAIFKGVNRHEMQPESGYTVTMEGMKKDIEIFHSLNINAVRTSHYPNDPSWYELCDREGIYVVCEANIESHGAGYGEKSYAHKAPYLQSHVERNVNMVKTFRNHPSIVIWSLGNEAGDGKNFTAAYKAVRALDASRPIHYERAQGGANTDIMCPMYARPWDVEKYVKNNPAKPYILCEYSHAMGNSNGDIHDYWYLVRKYPSAQGGFIWDFVDQALWKTDARGKWLAYGGDFGDYPNDENFNCNGIVDAVRNYHPGAYEVKHAYQPVHVRSFDRASGTAEIYNEFRFITLEGVKGFWKAEKNGEVIAKGELDVSDIAPDSAKKFSIGKKADGADAVTFSFVKNGVEIAHDQFTLPFEPKTVSGDGPEVKSPFKLNFWRAPNDNDRGWNITNVCKIWKQATETQKLPPNCESKLSTKKLGDGKYLVNWTVTIGDGLPDVPRLGLTFTLPKEYVNVKWYGLGPWENYSDREVAAKLGVYSAKVGLSSGIADADGRLVYPADSLNPDNYSEPGEQGHRGGCRWMELSDGKGGVVKVTALSAPFGFNAWPYSQKALEAARHQWDLSVEDKITVNINLRQMGVGGDDSWGAKPHDDDMIRKGRYSISFMVEGL